MKERYPLIRHKIQAPQTPKTLVRRQRLLDFLHENIYHKLILVSAGAGYGKTLMLSDYARDSELPVCWYSLDANDAHVPTFLEYLVASIRTCFPEFGESVLQQLESSEPPLENVEPLVRLLVREIGDNTDQYFVLVLDDFHEIAESEPVNALIDGLLRYLPEQCHIILSSRGIPRRLTLTRLAARQQVVGLGVSDLSFTADEIKELLFSLGHGDLSQAQIEKLAERSEGWITGILLATQVSDGSDRLLELAGTTEGIFDFLAEEVLARQDQEIQAFLLGSSLLPEMSPPLCNALLDIDDSAQKLRYLADQSLFVYSRDTQGSWYEYHQLFREFLVAKLEQDRPEDYRNLCISQADIMGNEGRWTQAVDSYFAAGAMNKAAEAMEIVIQEKFDAKEWEMIRDWLETLSPGLLRSHPRLQLFGAKISSEQGDFQRARGQLIACYQAYIARGDQVGAARALVQRGIAERLAHHIPQAIETLTQVVEMVGGDNTLAALQGHHNLGICYYIEGDSAQGKVELETAHRLAEVHGDEDNAAYIAHDMGNAELRQGHLIEARKNFHRALMHWRKTGDLADAALTLQGLGVVHQYLGQYAEAENRLEESLSKAQSQSTGRLEAYALANLGDLYRDTGKYPKALKAYRDTMALASSVQASSLMTYLLAAMGDTYRLMEDHDMAHQILVEALDQDSEESPSQEYALALLGLGALALEQGKPAEAGERLALAARFFEKAGLRRDLARAELHLARLAAQQGEQDALREHLEHVASLAKKLGTSQFVVAEGPAILPLLESCMNLAIEGFDLAWIKGQLEQLFAFEQPKPPLRVVRSEPFWELYGLDGGRVLRQGQLVTDWKAEKARTMAFLLATHPGGLHRDKIIVRLWPEVSQSKGTSRFHSTLYRLREAISKEAVSANQSIYRLDPDLPYRYDVAEFQRYAKLAEGRGESARVARQQAIQLYRTPFLETCDEGWCRQLRETLRVRQTKLLHLEAKYLLDSGAPSRAEALYTRLLAMDSLDEAAHRGIMQCRVARNEKAAAIRQYQECAHVLRRELGVSPSQETIDLYEAIRADQLAPAAP